MAPAFAVTQADTSTLCKGPEGLVVSVNLAVFDIIVDRSIGQCEGRDVFKCFEQRICRHQHEGDHQHERVQIGCGKSRQLSSALSMDATAMLPSPPRTSRRRKGVGRGRGVIAG